MTYSEYSYESSQYPIVMIIIYLSKYFDLTRNQLRDSFRGLYTVTLHDILICCLLNGAANTCQKIEWFIFGHHKNVLNNTYNVHA